MKSDYKWFIGILIQTLGIKLNKKSKAHFIKKEVI